MFTIDNDNGDIDSEVKTVDDGHHRGRWPYSDTLVLSPVISPVAALEWRRLSISYWDPDPPEPRSADALMFECQTADQYCIEPGNRGLFGVNANYGIQISAAGTHWVSCWLRARNTGSFYQGAAYDLDEPDPELRKKAVPPIDLVPFREGVQWLENLQISGPTTIVLPNATGGAATLPCELLIGISDSFPVPDPLP